MSESEQPEVENEKRLVIAISGASGSLYALHLIQALNRIRGTTQLIVSPSAIRVFRQEMEANVSSASDLLGWIQERSPATGIHQFEIQNFADIGARAASGSSHHDGMAIVPCSMKTLASIAHGMSGNLIERAADVTLKERRRLVVVPRETPYSLIHLRNMTSLTEAGAIVLPASPGFYHRPASFDDLGRFIAGRVLSALGVRLELIPPWDGDS